MHRPAAAFVLALLALGTLVLWLGIPVAGTWALGQVTDSKNGHYIATLLGVPLAMVLFAPVLFWLNRLYLRIRETEEGDGWDEEWDAEGRGAPPDPRGPLEPLLMGSLGNCAGGGDRLVLLLREEPAAVVSEPRRLRISARATAKRIALRRSIPHMPPAATRAARGLRELRGAGPSDIVTGEVAADLDSGGHSKFGAGRWAATGEPGISGSAAGSARKADQARGAVDAARARGR